jgi:hypothetical protein
MVRKTNRSKRKKIFTRKTVHNDMKKIRMMIYGVFVVSVIILIFISVIRGFVSAGSLETAINFSLLLGTFALMAGLRADTKTRNVLLEASKKLIISGIILMIFYFVFTANLAFGDDEENKDVINLGSDLWNYVGYIITLGVLLISMFLGASYLLSGVKDILEVIDKIKYQ